MEGDNRAKTQTSSTARAKAPRHSTDALVPSRQQYFDLKRQHPDAILLFRLGDFYETFDDDAKIVARDARITLTTKNFGRSGRAPMAGIPHHALNHYLGRLLACGHTLAIAEQMTEPGRGLVERAVTRVLSPGTVGEASLLPATENRYLAAIMPDSNRTGMAWVDVSTGEFAVMELPNESLSDELARLNPAECLIPDDRDEAALTTRGYVRRVEHWYFQPARSAERLCLQFASQSLAAYGCEELPLAIGAAGAIVAYLERTNRALLPLLRGLRTEIPDQSVGIDAATRRNLELTRSLRTGGTKGSLLSVLDQTVTAMGARTLRRMLSRPTRDLAELHRRQSIVAAFVGNSGLRASIMSQLAAIADLERLISRVTQGSVSARDFVTLARNLRHVPAVSRALVEVESAELAALATQFDACVDVVEWTESTVVEREDGTCEIRSGCSSELDRARDQVHGTRRWLAGLERTERERTGIRSLKVGFNKVFGYYLEVTRPNLPLVPSDYIRKQTVATGERYITASLKEAESRVLAADDEISTLEREALTQLGARVTQQAGRLIETARRLAELDALLSLAEVASRGGWARPSLSDGDELEIVAGRHPVVEAGLAGEPFIPNDCRLDRDHRIQLLTGPNMGGKSTFLRQTAIIVLLAQIGSFVPATSTRIGLVDRIFTRVGAQDDLAGGASTFMVEMVETATILNLATPRSLVILDEVGRGTSTYDGMAIARAVLEDLHDRVGARALFATHYLELTALEGDLDALSNAHVAALERDGHVIFLYAVQPGPADRAYGIHVARLAGLPRWVAERAETVLRELDCASTSESCGQDSRTTKPQGQIVAEGSAPYQLGLAGVPPSPDPATSLLRDLRQLDVESLTPGQAVDWLWQQKSRIESDRYGL